MYIIVSVLKNHLCARCPQFPESHHTRLRRSIAYTRWWSSHPWENYAWNRDPLVSRMSVKLQRDFQKGHEKNYHTYSMTVMLLLVEEILHQFIGSLSYYLPHFIYIQGGAGFPPSTVPLTTQIHLLKLCSPGCLQAKCFTFKSWHAMTAQQNSQLAEVSLKKTFAFMNYLLRIFFYKNLPFTDLVGGFNPSEKIWHRQFGSISPNFWDEHQQPLKFHHPDF